MMLLTTAHNDEDLRVQVRRTLGNEAVFADIPHGDITFVGKWVGGEKYRVLMERKKLTDIISCIQTGRYLQQWQRAYAAGWEKQYFIAEIGSQYREHMKTGLVEVKRGKSDWVPLEPRIEWHRVDAFLLQIREYLGVQVITTENVRETARQVVRLYQMFKTPPEDHNTLKKMFTPAAADLTLLEMFEGPSLTRKVAKELPHIGWELSKAAEAQFGSVKAMINATEEEWVEIPKIGKKVAGDIVGAVEKDVREKGKGRAREIGVLYG